MQIFNLNNLPDEILNEVGGKARGLYQLNKFGFKVPRGFILVDLTEEKDFEQAYEYYEKENLGEVAVRSSATIEDGANFSNAGQYETILNVKGKENFFTAIKDCLSSLGNFRSQKYGKTFLNTTNNKMTIVVQEMVDAKCAGVLFSKDPMNDKAILIECVDGLGEALVSGEKSAEQYTVVGEQINMPNKAILTEAQVRLLASSAVIAEENFGMPMDIEWAINKQNEIMYLQARPITVTTDDGVNLNEFDFKEDVTGKTITTCNVREMLSTAVTPLSLSTSVYSLDWGMRKMMEKNHAVKHIDDLPPFSCITPFYNSMFFNMSTNYINAYRIAGTCKETSDIVICGRVLEDFPDNFADYSSNFRRVLNLVYFLPFVASGKKAKNGIDRVISELSFNYDDTLEGLYQQTLDKFYLMEESFYFHYCSSYFSGAASMLANRAMQKYYKDPLQIDALISGVLTNIEGIESAQILDMMRELAGTILSKYPDAKTYDKNRLAEIIESDDGDIKASYDHFMKINGHRGINETEMRVDCWADNLTSFCDSLRGVIISYDKEEKKVNKNWTDYMQEILAPIKKSKRKSLKNQLLKARSGAWHREYTKSRCILTVCMFRRAYRRIAEMLVEKELLADKDLIYFLTKEEIGELIKGDKTLVKKAMKRRRLYPIQCSLKFEEVYSGKPVPIENKPTDGSVTSFQGLPASPGVVMGKARIIRSIEDANKLEEGEIMVASCTDVGWTPYYCLASGLITEIGSCLSHGVVVAREYGLPTIVNAVNIMNSIHDGDMITMDGNKGTISIG